MQETFKEKLFYGSLAVLSILAVILIIYYLEEIMLLVYYTPLYEVFGGYLYFPFYLYVFHMALLGMFLVIIFYVAFTNWEEFWQKGLAVIIFLAISILFITTAYQEILQDFSLAKVNSYSTLECSVSDIEKSLKRRKSRRNIHYTFKDIELNQYQYVQMKDIDYMLDQDKQLVIYYMPNSEVMLKYELK